MSSLKDCLFIICHRLLRHCSFVKGCPLLISQRLLIRHICQRLLTIHLSKAAHFSALKHCLSITCQRLLTIHLSKAVHSSSLKDCLFTICRRLLTIHLSKVACSSSLEDQLDYLFVICQRVLTTHLSKAADFNQPILNFQQVTYSPTTV